MRAVEPPVAQGIRHPGSQPWALAAQRRSSSTPRGSSTQWATARALEAPCGKEWSAKQEKKPPTKPGWAEPRTTAQSSCSVNHPGHNAEQGTWGSRTRKHREAVVDGLRMEVCGKQKQSNDPRNNQHSPSTPTTGLHERGKDTSRSTGRSGRQEAATRHNMRRDELVTVQGPVKKKQPDGMSHRGGGRVDQGKAE